MKFRGSNRKEPWWFSPLFGASEPWVSLAAGATFAFFAAVRWVLVARDGWWPQIIVAGAVSGIAAMFLATGVSQRRAKRSR